MKDREYPRVSPELLQRAAERIRNACCPLSEDPDIRKSQEEYLSFKTGYDLRVTVQQSYNEGFEEGFQIGLAKILPSIFYKSSEDYSPLQYAVYRTLAPM